MMDALNEADSKDFQRKRIRFRFVERVGSGQYGNVYKALDMETHTVYALKSISRYNLNEGLPMSFFREAKCLEMLKCPNIVKSYGFYFPSEDDMFLVLEYCETDLHVQLSARPFLHESQIKNIMYQLLSGLEVMHKNKIAHRDIKPSNLLVKNGTMLKIADFGLSRELKEGVLTNNVTSYAYRAPELILGSCNYTTAVDIWSAGVVFYELCMGERFPSATTNLSQLDKMFRLTGTPIESKFLSCLPEWRYVSLLYNYPRTLESILGDSLPKELAGAVGIIGKMLQVDPCDRATAHELLQNPFFSNLEHFEPLANIEISEHLRRDSQYTPANPVIHPPPLLLNII